mgnify:CR=1 FL=1
MSEVDQNFWFEKIDRDNPGEDSLSEPIDLVICPKMTCHNDVSMKNIGKINGDNLDTMMEVVESFGDDVVDGEITSAKWTVVKRRRKRNIVRSIKKIDVRLKNIRETDDDSQNATMKTAENYRAGSEDSDVTSDEWSMVKNIGRNIEKKNKRKDDRLGNDSEVYKDDLEKNNYDILLPDGIKKHGDVTTADMCEVDLAIRELEDAKRVMDNVLKDCSDVDKEREAMIKYLCAYDKFQNYFDNYKAKSLIDLKKITTDCLETR